MASPTQEMLAAFNSLADSIRDVSIGNSVKRAQNKVEEIRQDQNMNDFEKIKAQQSLAKMVGGEVARYGGNASMVNQAMQSLAPEVPDTRLAALESTGKTSIAEATRALQDEAEDRQFKKEERAFKRQKMLQDSQIASQERLATMRAGGKELKALPAPLINKISEVAESHNTLKMLKEEFSKRGGAIGPIAGNVPDLAYGVADKLTLGQLGGADAVAYRTRVRDFFNQYRRVITGAAASVPELKALAKALPTEEDLSNNFEAKIDEQIKGVESALKTRLKVLKATGRDVSDLEEMLGLGEEVSQEGSQSDSSAPSGAGLGKYITFTK